jgi:hypothetical protein
VTQLLQLATAYFPVLIALPPYSGVPQAGVWISELVIEIATEILDE